MYLYCFSLFVQLYTYKYFFEHNIMISMVGDIYIYIYYIRLCVKSKIWLLLHCTNNENILKGLLDCNMIREQKYNFIEKCVYNSKLIIRMFFWFLYFEFYRIVLNAFLVLSFFFLFCINFEFWKRDNSEKLINVYFRMYVCFYVKNIKLLFIDYWQMTISNRCYFKPFIIRILQKMKWNTRWQQYAMKIIYIFAIYLWTQILEIDTKL